MNKTTFTPEESLLLISATIEDTKKRFEENGFLFLFWGLLIFFVSLSQFVLTKLELNEILTIENWTIRNWPVLLYPLGGIVTGIHVKKTYKKLPKTILGNISAAMGWLLGANFMILGFFFSNSLAGNLIPVFIIIFAFWCIISGVIISFKPLIIGGILLNLIGFAAFYINWQNQPLMFTVGSIVALIIPGFLLKKNKKQENV
ncbi:MAG: hypothetical protein K9H49_09045 [Bacteroidales bacterium]|nr:hypothetical protein [Bacteroidales bacterium]MCF8390744.1 hypothetical protein [Bacteroidales bacterium]